LPGSDGEALSSAEQVPGAALVVEEEEVSSGVEMLSVDKLGGDDMLDGKCEVGYGIIVPRALKADGQLCDSGREPSVAPELRKM
jgi:hypothetical protein